MDAHVVKTGNYLSRRVAPRDRIKIVTPVVKERAELNFDKARLFELHIFDSSDILLPGLYSERCFNTFHVALTSM